MLVEGGVLAEILRLVVRWVWLVEGGVCSGAFIKIAADLGWGLGVRS